MAMASQNASSSHSQVFKPERSNLGSVYRVFALMAVLGVFASVATNAQDAPDPIEVNRAKIPEARGDTALPAHFKWLVLNPIPIPPVGSTAQPDESAQKKAFVADLLAPQGGEAQVNPRLGAKMSVNGVKLEWKDANPVNDIISLNSAEGKDDFEVAYAWTEFDIPTATQAWLGIGSDDGIRVWLNGRLVHEKWSARPVHVDEDVVSVPLKAGKNCLLLKVQNITGSWGFACRLMDADVRARRMVSAARDGDLPVLKGLIDQGFDINGRTSDGLTPYATARFWGQKEVADFLAKNGSDIRAAPLVPGKLVDEIFKDWNTSDSPGATVAVIENGKVVFEQGYGMADLEHQVPLSPKSVFYIASTSKQFTAASVALLSLEGKISLSDDIHKYIPELRDYGDPVTVDELIHHTSGIRDYFALMAVSGWNWIDHLDNDRVVKLLARQRALNFKPGTRHLYSNSNYVLLAELVKRVSGQPLPEFAADRIFHPLGMNHTRIENDIREIVPNRVISYSSNIGHAGFSQFIKTIESYGDGNVLTTVDDLARWDENFYSGKVGGAKLLQLLLTRGVLADGKSIDYAFGLMHGQYRGLPTVSHGGGYMGFRTELLRFPDQRLSVVVLCNLASMDPDLLANKVADIYLAGHFPLAKAAQPGTPAMPARVAIDLDPRVFDAYVGRFSLDVAPQFILTYSRDGSNYYTQATGQARFPIFPSSETEFFLKVVDAQVTFHREADGSVKRMTLHQNGDFDAHRVDEAVALPVSDLGSYAGRFYSEELDVSYDVAVESDHLVARNPQVISVPLTQNGRDAFDAKLGEVLFHRDANGKIDGLYFSSGQANNLWFAREPNR